MTRHHFPEDPQLGALCGRRRALSSRGVRRASSPPPRHFTPTPIQLTLCPIQIP